MSVKANQMLGVQFSGVYNTVGQIFYEDQQFAPTYEYEGKLDVLKYGLCLSSGSKYHDEDLDVGSKITTSQTKVKLPSVRLYAKSLGK